MMTRKLGRLGFALVLTACGSASGTTASANSSAPAASTSASAATDSLSATAPPQALPFLAVIRAAKASDAVSFKATYSKHIQDDTDQSDWTKNVGEAHANLERLCGNCDPADFTFTYAGDASHGVLSIAPKNKEPLQLKVVAEGTAWKIDER